MHHLFLVVLLQILLQIKYSYLWVKSRPFPVFSSQELGLTEVFKTKMANQNMGVTNVSYNDVTSLQNVLFFFCKNAGSTPVIEFS